jgi:hypothetical protein
MEMTMKARMAGRSLGLVVAGTMLLSGCGGFLIQAKEDYWMYRAPVVAQSQILNPEAGKNRKVVAGLDGPAAEQVNHAYVQSFEREAETKAADTFSGLAGIASN